MAIFHLTTKPISRGKGQSAIAAAAYRSGERLRDEQAGEQKYYTSRADRIIFEGVFAPKDAPAWAQDRNELWNHAERAEKRKDARLAREIEVALPHEMTDRQREFLVKDFVREQFTRKGVAADVAIHAPDKGDDRNYHAHILITERKLGPDGFEAKKDTTFNKPEQLATWRAEWAHLTNRHLERHGIEARVDHRSLKEQGIEREPTVHVGYAGMEIAARGGASDRYQALQDIMARNDIRVEMKALDGELRELGRLDEREQAEAAARTEPAVSPLHVPELRGPARASLEVVDAVTGGVEKLVDFVTDFLAGGSSPKPGGKPEILTEERRESRTAMAILSLRESMERGERLSASDIRHLTPGHLEAIRQKGDKAISEMIDEAHDHARRYWKGDERERDQDRER
jgi:hypothetical protein